jgi:hypothetical protein
MRAWGRAVGPRDEGIDVGINSRDLLTAFAPDIARLPLQDQLHWAHYSSPPDGEICWEMFETRMQQRPPHSPGIVDFVGKARAQLNDSFRARYAVSFYESSGICVGRIGELRRWLRRRFHRRNSALNGCEGRLKFVHAFSTLCAA